MIGMEGTLQIGQFWSLWRIMFHPNWYLLLGLRHYIAQSSSSKETVCVLRIENSTSECEARSNAFVPEYGVWRTTYGVCLLRMPATVVFGYR